DRLDHPGVGDELSQHAGDVRLRGEALAPCPQMLAQERADGGCEQHDDGLDRDQLPRSGEQLLCNFRRDLQDRILVHGRTPFVRAPCRDLTNWAPIRTRTPPIRNTLWHGSPRYPDSRPRSGYLVML